MTSSFNKDKGVPTFGSQGKKVCVKQPFLHDRGGREVNFGSKLSDVVILEWSLKFTQISITFVLCVFINLRDPGRQ